MRRCSESDPDPNTTLGQIGTFQEPNSGLLGYSHAAQLKPIRRLSGGVYSGHGCVVPGQSSGCAKIRRAPIVLSAVDLSLHGQDREYKVAERGETIK